MCMKKVFDGKGKEHALDSEKTGDLSKLQTEAKDSLVSAVNEVCGKIPSVTAEEWVFTLEDDSAVTKKVAVMA